MSSILTNNSAMNALSTLRGINNNLSQTQDRISSGLKVSSAKDNAAYFAISETMKGDSSMLKSINESLTQTKNSVATAAFGATEFKDLASDFATRLSFAQNADAEGLAKIEADLKGFVAQMKTVIEQSTFNGEDLVNADATGALQGTRGATTETISAGPTLANDGTLTYAATTNTDYKSDEVSGGVAKTIVTGVTRKGGAFSTTTMTVQTADLTKMVTEFEKIANGDTVGGANQGFAAAAGADADFAGNTLKLAELNLKDAIGAATTLGSAEKSLEAQQEFLTKLADNIDAGVGAMVDANMEEEAARLQALQVQQQLASQSLSIANQAPQNILSLFR